MITSSEDQYFVDGIEQDLEWFCKKVSEPIPIDPLSKENVFRRMISIGWIKQRDYDIYVELMKEEE